VTLRGGAQLTASVDIPAGAAGPDTRRRHRQLAREKFMGAAVPWMGAAAAEEVAGVVEGLDSATRDDVRRLVRLLGQPFST